MLKLIYIVIIKPFVLTLIQSITTLIYPGIKSKANYSVELPPYNTINIYLSLSHTCNCIDIFMKIILLTPNNLVFRPNYSTELSTSYLTNHNRMDNNRIHMNIYLYLSKTFDTLDHNKLLINTMVSHDIGSIIFVSKLYK